MRIGYLKVLRDLTSDYTKNLMLVLAIATGVFGIGAISGSHAVINREMGKNYGGTVPASATIEVGNNLTPAIVADVKKIAGIKEAERHATLLGRMKIDGKWYPLLLFVVDDFNDKRTNKFNHLSGENTPPEGTMLTERTALPMMHAIEGEEITIKTPHGEPKKIKLSGIVHDPGLAPAWQEQAGYGYITLSTLHWLGEEQGFDQLRILVSDSVNSVTHIRAKASDVASALESKGYDIHEIQVPPPGRHPHQGQMNAVLSIFTVFSYLLLVLASILVANSMATLMVKQVRQIGVMKTIGATSAQIASLYLFMMLILCVISLLIGIPLSRVAATAFYSQIAPLINIEITDRSIPFRVLLMQVGAGILIPLVAASFPVIRGSLIAVRNALDNFGVANNKQRGTSLIIRFSQLNFFSESLALSIRNVFRHRARLIMTLGLLAAGGAMFMTALNVSAAWDKNLRRIYDQRLYDLEVRLTAPVRTDTLFSLLAHIPGVKLVEGWDYSTTSFIKDLPYEIVQTYPDKGHGTFVIQALPVPTRLLNLFIVEGHWLQQATSQDIVLNQIARSLSPGVKIGDSISLSAEGKATRWRVIGFSEDVGSPATAYVAATAFSKAINTSGTTRMIRIAYDDRSKEYASRKNKEVEALLAQQKISVSATIPVWLLHNAIAAHMRVLVNSLLAMAILMALVGSLGLMSSVSMNIMERTREIGVMRAIGATPKKIKSLIVWEGIITGGISIFIAFVLSIFLSLYMGRFIGNMAFRTPLSLSISYFACVTWVVIVFLGSYAATLYPARRAGKITTREALAYE